MILGGFMKNFLSVISANWLGLVIGLAVAIVLCFILRITVFKGNKVGIFISLILCLVFAFAGMFIQSNFFSTVDESKFPTAQEQAAELDKQVSDGWKNTNGGFTFEQIADAQNDNECPTYPDQIINIDAYDYGDYISFAIGYENNIYNAVFIKTGSGLVYDGLLNTTADFENTHFYLKWVLGFIPWPAYDVVLDSYRWYQSFTCPIYTETQRYWWDSYKYDNLVSVSSQSPTFLKWLYNGYENQSHALSYALQQIPVLMSSNINNYFTKFDMVELIGNSEDSLKTINTFYNYIYENINQNKKPITKLVDVTNLVCVPIPQDLRSNYPVSDAFKEKYPDTDYYGVYNCDIAVNCTLKDGNKLLYKDTKNEEYFRDNKDSSAIQVEVIENQSDVANLVIKFVDKQNSNISNVDLQANPITIEFNCVDLDERKILKIDSVNKLQNVSNVILKTGVEWKYRIYSDALIFDKFMGSFTLSETSETTFEYYYLNNYTIASVGLNPIGSIDESKIDLVNHPVKIMLSNDKHSYEFLFNDTASLDTYKTQLVEFGDYNYTILSDQLIFSATTGSLTITSTDRVMLFNYALKTDSDLSLNLTFNREVFSDDLLVDFLISPNVVSSIRFNFFDGADLIFRYLVFDSVSGKLLRVLSVDSCSDDHGSLSLGLNLSAGVYAFQVQVISPSSDLILSSNVVELSLIADHLTGHYFYDLTL